MIELASEKMPNAHLYQGDFSKELVEPLRNFRYDYIVATYSLHHLTDAQKSNFLLDLRNYLKENGKIIIGDVAFETRKDLERCRLAAGGRVGRRGNLFCRRRTEKRFTGTFIYASIRLRRYSDVRPITSSLMWSDSGVVKNNAPS